MASKWYDLGIELHIDADKLEEIKVDYHDARTRCREMFKHWIDNNPKDSSWKTLIQALESNNLSRATLADDIQKKLLSGILYSYY